MAKALRNRRLPRLLMQRGDGLAVRTSDKRMMRVCWRGAFALVAYLAVLIYAHVHIALEPHHHHHDASHPVVAATESSSHEDHDHTPHSAADHQLDASIAPLSFAVDLVVYAPDVSSEIRVDRVDGPLLPATILDDKPEHPPPRVPGQPRSPPIV